MRKLMLCVLLMTGSLLHGVDTPYEMKAGIDKQRKKHEKDILKRPAPVPAPQPPAAAPANFIFAVANGHSNQQLVSFEKPILFNTLTAQTASLTYDEGVFTTMVPGIYEITFGATWTCLDPHSIIALRVNGKVLESTRITTENSWSSMTVIVDASANKKTTFEVVNDTFFPPCSDLMLQGDNQGNTSSAYINIKKIN